MIGTGTISGCYLLLQYFRPVDNDFIRNGFVVGISWFALNIILDALVLIPMMKTTFFDYFMSVRLGYIAIPAISVTMGFMLEVKLK